MEGKILVTGGAGYLGSHVVVALADAGYTPIVLDNFATSSRAVMPRLSALTGTILDLVDADVRDTAALRRLFHDQPIAAVVHCAALKGVSEGEERPLAYWDTNVGGTVALAEVMGEAGVARIVQASSATVYGQPDRLPVTEDAPLKPQSVYGRTMRAAEDFLRDLTRANANWRIAILRYFNPAGAHASARIGERISERARTSCRTFAGSPPAKSASSRSSERLADRGRHADPRLPARRRPRRGARRRGALPRDRAGRHDVQPGTGRGYSVLQVVGAFERACGRRIARTFVPRRVGDVSCYYADPSRASALLAWRAQRDIDAICADAWRWQQSGGF
jgi:UDP-glucose 4-epimerase